MTNTALCRVPPCLRPKRDRCLQCPVDRVGGAAGVVRTLQTRRSNSHTNPHWPRGRSKKVVEAREGRPLAFRRDPPPPSRSGPKAPGGGGFGLTFPNPKRALGAHGVPHWGSSAPAHHTHPLAMQPAGGAHASSSSIVARALSAAVSLACSRCALYWGRGRGEGGPPVRGTVGAPAPLVL